MSEELIRLREIESAARDVFAYPAGSPRDVWNRLAVALGETALHADCGVCDEQSRLAEIGRIVERLLDTDATYTAHLSLDYDVKRERWEARRAVTDAIGGTGYGVGRPSAFGKALGPTLLESLRALAAEIGGKNA